MAVNNSVLGNKRVTLDQCGLVSALPVSNKVKTLIGDIRSLVSRITIFENIFNPVLSGEIILSDDSSLSTLVPLVGVELLYFKFSTMDEAGNTRWYGNSTPKMFSVYDQTNRTPVNKGTEEYRLGIVSPEMFTLADKKLSVAYKNMPVERVISDILKSPKYGGSDKKFTFEATGVNTNFVIPYLTPLEAIKLASLMGQSPNADTNYVFYETLSGFHFSSIRNMIQSGQNGTIPKVVLLQGGSIPYKSTLTQLRADSIEVVSGFDSLKQFTQGAFASTTIGVDILAGKYQHTISTHRDPAFQNRILTDGASGVSMYPSGMGHSNPTVKMFLVPTTSISAANTAMTRLDPSIKDNFIERTIVGRHRELLSLASRCVRVTVSGAPELQAGTLVDIEVPTPQQAGDLVASVRDVASGRYLIVAAQHSIINSGDGSFLYQTVFEAYSDSYSTK